MLPTILFLDGDGTIWYPKATQRTQKSHWIYHHESTKSNPLEHLELTPRIIEALTYFVSHGTKIFLISANPLPEDQAKQELAAKLEYFDLMQYFTSYYSSPGDDPLGKATVMQNILAREGVSPSEALMVGDSYSYDYQAAQSIGVPAYWIENPVSTRPETGNEECPTISEVWELMENE